MGSLAQARVLITGATGFIGQHLCRRLMELNVATYGLSRSASAVTLPNGVVPLVANITQRESLVAALEQVRPTHVVHLAAVGVNQPFLQEAMQVNVDGTRHVLETSLAYGVKRFIQVGTCHEYTAELNPASPYATSKLNSWRTWQTFATSHSLEAVALRLFHVYGPAQPTSGLITAAILAALRGERFEMTPGEQERDFVFISDVVEALLASLRMSFTGIRTYDVGTGTSCTVKALVHRIFAEVGGQGEVLLGSLPYREGEIMRLIANPQPAAQDLAWQAQTRLEVGLRKTIDWQRQQLMSQTSAMEYTVA